MARRTEVTAVSIRGEVAHALVTVFEPVEGDPEGQEVAVGEWQISFPSESTMPDIMHKVDEARTEIEKASERAKALRTRINAEIARAG